MPSSPQHAINFVSLITQSIAQRHTMGAGFIRGRLAPSPSGYLHLGNAWACLMAWLLCRRASGTLVLRIEDIDPARSRQEYIQSIMEDLAWLGLDWDEGPGSPGGYGPYLQSQRYEIYKLALDWLQARGMVYPCFCSRKELRAIASAPHVGDEGVPYPGTCANLSLQEQQHFIRQGRQAALRVRAGTGIYSFIDGIRQQKVVNQQNCGGDFALRRSDGVIAYQLAVSVDDALMNITQVVRGTDIAASTPRQLMLFELFGIKPPQYTHVPLVCDHTGDRLAKRHRALGLRFLREQGVTSAALIGYLAHAAGLVAERKALTAQELLRKFKPESISETSIYLEETFVAQLAYLSKAF